jgi:hypothetical protein
MAAYAWTVQELSWSLTLSSEDDVRDGAKIAAKELALMGT